MPAAAAAAQVKLAVVQRCAGACSYKVLLMWAFPNIWGLASGGRYFSTGLVAGSDRLLGCKEQTQSFAGLQGVLLAGHVSMANCQVILSNAIAQSWVLIQDEAAASRNDVCLPSRALHFRHCLLTITAADVISSSTNPAGFEAESLGLPRAKLHWHL